MAFLAAPVARAPYLSDALFMSKAPRDDDEDSGFESGRSTPDYGSETLWTSSASDFGSSKPANDVGDTLDTFYQEIIGHSQTFLGYPVNQSYNYGDLFRFMQYSLNNVGDPYGKSNYLLNSHKFEREVIKSFTHLTGGSEEDTWGYITNGGTEGNIYGLYLAREVLPQGIVYFSEDSHYSVQKALRLLQMRSIQIRSQENGEMDYEELARHLKIHQDSPAIIFANIGSTMKGAIDNLPIIRQLLQESSISKHYIHCDCALSGMILPFVDSAQPFGFGDGADSLSISGHKMIGSPVPCGVVLAKKDHVSHVGGGVEYVGIMDTTLTGSRSGFTPLLLWYALKTAGPQYAGMKRQVSDALDMAEYATQRLQSIGIPAWRHKNSLTVVFPRPSSAMIQKWQLAPNGEIAHLITMPSTTKQQIEAFIQDYMS